MYKLKKKRKVRMNDEFVLIKKDNASGLLSGALAQSNHY